MVAFRFSTAASLWRVTSLFKRSQAKHDSGCCSFSNMFPHNSCQKISLGFDSCHHLSVFYTFLSNCVKDETILRKAHEHEMTVKWHCPRNDEALTMETFNLCNNGNRYALRYSLAFIYRIYPFIQWAIMCRLSILCGAFMGICQCGWRKL